MTLRDLVLNNRSHRRFRQEIPIAPETLRELVDLARFSASGSNLQPLKYYLSWQPEQNARIFPHLAWAGYLEDWPGPAEGERPAGYILILGDKTIRDSFGIDPGIAAQTILLGATEKGLRGCIIASIQKAFLRSALGIPERYELLYAIALGEPAETVVLEDLPPNGEIRYWRDEAGVHHVPKRSLDELILT